MTDYFDVFFAIEITALWYWESHSTIKDRDVIRAFDSLLKSFDNKKEGTLSSEISKGVKAILILRKKQENGDYTLGEITSCILFLKKIVQMHKTSNGTGYLKWI